MSIQLRKRRLVVAFVLTSLPAAGALAAAAPTAPQALGIKPVQKDVDYDQPAGDEVAQCTIKAEKSGGKTGWVVRNAKDQILRNFVDGDGDNRVDQWSYFKDGVEVYRDIDSNHNGKADQCRWLNTAGTRWGTDNNEDRVIDAWEVISAEEASAELVAAVRTSDRARFERLLISPRELGGLGLASAKLEELQKRVAAAPAAFEQYLKDQKVVKSHSNWVYFGGGRPGTVPQGTDESTADITVYENVAAMVETDGKHAQVPIATLIRVNNNWKLIDAPSDAGEPFFSNSPQRLAQNDRPDAPGSERPSERAQKLMDELQKLESTTETKRKTEILEELAADSKPGEDRAQWLRQLADIVSAAAQVGTYPDGVKQLDDLYKKLDAGDDKELAAYVQFRFMMADYNQQLSQQSADPAKIQAKWLEDLESYVKAHPTSADSAEAMLQLAMAQEFAGDEQNAQKWYHRVTKSFPKTTSGVRAEGAARRLDSVGKPMVLRGKSLGGKSVDLAAVKGKVVLVHYWSSDVDACRVDLPALEKMASKYEGGLQIVGVSLDNDRRVVENYLRGNPLPWPTIWEEGGSNSRLANEMGILTIPTMILIDQKGKVVNRNVHAINLDEELKGMELKPRMANRR